MYSLHKYINKRWFYFSFICSAEECYTANLISRLLKETLNMYIHPTTSQLMEMNYLTYLITWTSQSHYSHEMLFLLCRLNIEPKSRSLTGNWTMFEQECIYFQAFWILYFPPSSHFSGINYIFASSVNTCIWGQNYREKLKIITFLLHLDLDHVPSYLNMLTSEVVRENGNKQTHKEEREEEQTVRKWYTKGTRVKTGGRAGKSLILGTLVQE